MTVSTDQPEARDYISLLQLYRCGITAGMAWHLLGFPQKSDTAQPFPRRADKHYYLKSFVADRTQGRTFQILRVSETIRQMVKGEGKLKLLTEMAQSVPIRTNFPDLDWEEITQIGCLDRWREQGFHIQPRMNSHEMRTLWGYTYLKHNCTNYDELCDAVTGRMFARYAYPIVLHRVNKAILDRFPQCLEKVKGLRKSPRMRCPTCLKTQEGIFNGHYWTKPEGWLYQLSNSKNYIRTICSRECTKFRRNVPKRARHHTFEIDINQG